MNVQDEVLGFAFFQLKEFAYAVDELEAIVTGGLAAQGSAKMRFYMNGLYHCLSAWFLLDRRPGAEFGGVMFEALSAKGLDVELDAIRECLRQPVGATTLGEVIRQFRNKTLTHNVRLSLEPIDRWLTKEARLTPEDGDRFSNETFPGLCHAVKALYTAVGKRVAAEVGPGS